MSKTNRRTLLATGGRGIVGTTLAPLAACSTSPLSTPPSENGTLAAMMKEVEALVPSLLESTRTPGLSIAVITNARLSWSRGFGVASTASHAPPAVTTETIFDAASISKTVFAYAVMKLHEGGVLDLDTPLTKYASERWVTDPRFDLITARHVLSHTGGMQNWRTDKEPLRIHFAPGTQWMYSGEGYSYLQSVVARLTGQAFDAYMRAHIFDPFQMPTSGFLWNAALASRYAIPHDGTGAVVKKPQPTVTNVARYGAAGGLWTTPSEYASSSSTSSIPRRVIRLA